MSRPSVQLRAILRSAAAALLAFAIPAVNLLAQPSAQPLQAARLADLRGEAASTDVRHVADWAVHSGDHAGLPFVIVDKRDSRVYVFAPDGQLRGASAALVGAARGDDAVPGIGSRAIASIQPEERTTPAGRFTATLGRGPKGEDILWVDYDSALALHRVVTHVPQEQRLQRLQSPEPADRRITYGCINVPVAFYDGVVRPAFTGTQGIVYILPEVRRVEDFFGSHHVRRVSLQASGGASPAR